MFLNYEPGDFVINPKNTSWGTGQIQSVIKNKVTVNFENVGKKVTMWLELLLNFMMMQNFRKKADNAVLVKTF